MPSGKATLLILFSLFLILSAMWYFSPLGIYLQHKLQAWRDRLATRLAVKKLEEDDEFIY